ncbi:MAG: hypothetical protein HUU57_17255, partial [Bdellovibrio sp.]|nr:hypothetical protein [Bdellovibrio sp.]
AGIFSPQGMEVKFSYSTTFQTSETDTDGRELAARHAQHLFGFLHSPALVAGYNLNSDTPGIGAPRLPLTYQITQDQSRSGVRKITYKTSGILLLHKTVAQEILPIGAWEITLPANLDEFYDENCTDPHYSSIGDFWYFYDPFVEGCEYLSEAPLATKVIVKIFATPKVPTDNAALDEIRSDNGNGELFQITTINGFSEDAQNPQDDGRLSFEQVNIWLRKNGFSETVVASYANRPILQFEKTLKKKDGSMVAVRITRLLAETAIAKKNVTFAKFFKDAMKNADVVIYAGHSGLGGNLDIASLEDKAGALEFTLGKQQLLFLDGCSTYSYYLSMFADRAPKNQLRILTNGLVSYFTYEPHTHIALLKRLFKVNESPTWSEVLTDMERPLRGMSYLLSVGSL